MKTRPISLLLLTISLPLLNACVNDAASLQIDGKDHSLSLVREQKWPWEKRVDLFVVVSRMPNCQRRHRLRNSSISASTVDVFSPDAAAFYLQQGNSIYFVETETCEGFRELTESPAIGMGQKLGKFAEVGGVYRFVDEGASGGVAIPGS